VTSFWGVALTCGKEALWEHRGNRLAGKGRLGDHDLTGVKDDRAGQFGKISASASHGLPY